MYKTFPRDLPFDLKDPLLDTYHVEGADVPEMMQAARPILRGRLAAFYLDFVRRRR